MHTRAVLKIKVSFHVRSVIGAVNVLQIRKPWLTSPISHAQVLAVASTVAQVTLLSLELGCIYLKLRKPTGFFFSTLKLVQTQPLVTWSMALNDSVGKFMGRVQLCSNTKIDNQKVGAYQLLLDWKKQGQDNPGGSGKILFAEVFFCRMSLSPGLFLWDLRAGDRIPSTQADARWATNRFTLILAWKVTAEQWEKQRRWPRIEGGNPES